MTAPHVRTANRFGPHTLPYRLTPGQGSAMLTWLANPVPAQSPVAGDTWVPLDERMQARRIILVRRGVVHWRLVGDLAMRQHQSTLPEFRVWAINTQAERL